MQKLLGVNVYFVHVYQVGAGDGTEGGGLDGEFGIKVGDNVVIVECVVGW